MKTSGTLGVSTKYLVLLSEELRITQNVPGHLQTLEGRLIIGPAELALAACGGFGLAPPERVSPGVKRSILLNKL